MVKAVDREAEKAAKTAMRRRYATARKTPTMRKLRADQEAKKALDAKALEEPGVEAGR